MTYWPIEQAVPENPDAFNSSNQRTLRNKGVAEQFIHADGRRYELFETVAAGNFGRTLADQVATCRQRHPSLLFLAVPPTDQFLGLYPNCIGHIYVQADQPRVFGWDMTRREEDEETGGRKRRRRS